MTGDCLLHTIDDQHQRLVSLLATQPDTLDLSAVVDADVSFVQLVVAAARSAGLQDRQLALAGVTPAVRSIFERAGFGIDPLSGLLTTH